MGNQRPKPSRKRRRGPGKAFTPQEALKALSALEQQLEGTLSGDHVRVSADPQAAQLLDCAGFGTRVLEGDDDAAAAGQQQQHLAWGGLVSVGALGPLDIQLPAEVTSRMAATPGLALRQEPELKQQPGEEEAGSETPAVLLRRPPPEALQAQQQRARQRRAPGGRSAPPLPGAPTPYALSLEEGFFLAHALRALRVGGLTAEQLWDACIAARPNFAHSYVPLAHFRAKGWLVRPGVNYGADYVLYSDHPSAAHASYCVLALKQAAPLAWADVEAVNRVVTQVSKRLILFRTEGAASSLARLPAITVEERLVKRWVPGTRGEDYLARETAFV